MHTRCLLVASNRELTQQLQHILKSVGVAVEVAVDESQGGKRLLQDKFEACVVDCDGLPGGRELLQTVRTSPSNRGITVFAVVQGPTTPSQAFQLGANFVFEQPLSAETTLRTLHLARGLLLREQRRYRRHPVDMMVRLTSPSLAPLRTPVVDISEGGLAVALERPLPAKEPLRVQFVLPETSGSIEARAEVAWFDARGHVGVRFLDLDARSRDGLQRWLSNLKPSS